MSRNEIETNGWNGLVSAISAEAAFFNDQPTKPVTIVLDDDREIRFKGVNVCSWEKEIRLCLKGAEITRIINCDRQSEENGYNYKCPKLSSDDWDELQDPCEGCCHRTYKTIVEKVGR